MIKKLVLKYLNKKVSHYSYQIMSLEDAIDSCNRVNSVYMENMLIEHSKLTNTLKAYRAVICNLRNEE